MCGEAARDAGSETCHARGKRALTRNHAAALLSMDSLCAPASTRSEDSLPGIADAAAWKPGFRADAARTDRAAMRGARGATPGRCTGHGTKDLR